MLKAGTSRRDISPREGEELAGYPHYPRNNTGVHDPLFASCLYLDGGETEVALVTLDLLFFSKKHVLRVRRMAEEASGIRGENIMISCTHTHSGPWAAGRLDIESLEAGREQSAEYVDFLVSQIVGGIAEAKRGAFEASFACATAVCGAESGVGGNRRSPGGPHDPLVGVLAVRDANRIVRGVFVNYTLHPTFIHEWSTVVTADYPCYLRMEVNGALPEAVVGFSQGASGNQSSRYYRQGESFDEAERVGRALGRAALKALEGAAWTENPDVAAASKEIEVELRSFGSEEELVRQVEADTARYRELYERYGDSRNREEYYLWQNANLKMLGSEDQLGYVRMLNRGVKIELMEDERPAELQVIRIGDALVIGCPGEVFVEFALYLKAMAPFRVTVFNELANGCLPGYVYTPESLVEGGYETDTSMLAPGFGRKLTDAVLELIESIR
ncbi:MAG: hypothetical protein GX647_12045 [Clostridiales bacterium]|nr:hypothetical protein [Clostridiales bacterium]